MASIDAHDTVGGDIRARGDAGASDAVNCRVNVAMRRDHGSTSCDLCRSPQGNAMERVVLNRPKVSVLKSNDSCRQPVGEFVAGTLIRLLTRKVSKWFAKIETRNRVFFDCLRVVVGTSAREDASDCHSIIE